MNVNNWRYPHAREDYIEARSRWIDAINAGAAHVVVSAHWDTVCLLAHRLGIVPGVSIR